MRAALLLAALAAALTACGRLPSVPLPSLPGAGLGGGRTVVEGVGFRSRVAADEEGRRFVVAVGRADRAPALAAEAGRVEAFQYCLARFGGTEVAWAVSPEAAAGAPLGERGALSLSGVCTDR